eukprot:gene29273-12515_t
MSRPNDNNEVDLTGLDGSSSGGEEDARLHHRATTGRKRAVRSGESLGADGGPSKKHQACPGQGEPPSGATLQLASTSRFQTDPIWISRLINQIRIQKSTLESKRDEVERAIQEKVQDERDLTEGELATLRSQAASLSMRIASLEEQDIAMQTKLEKAGPYPDAVEVDVLKAGAAQPDPTIVVSST